MLAFITSRTHHCLSVWRFQKDKPLKIIKNYIPIQRKGKQKQQQQQKHRKRSCERTNYCLSQNCSFLKMSEKVILPMLQTNPLLILKNILFFE